VPNPDRNIYFERRSGNLGGLEQYAQDLELRLERFAERVRGRSIEQTTDITNIFDGAASPLTTKGDLWGYDTGDARVPVGTDDYLLFADSTDPQGVLWKDPVAELNDQFSHSALDDLDVPADHLWAFLHDGTRAATGDFDMDGFDIDMNGGLLVNAGYVEVDQLGNAVDAWCDMKSDSGESAGVRIFGASGLALWRFRKNTVAQTGSNTGGNLVVEAFDDAGAAIDTPIRVIRAAGGDIDFARRLDMQTQDIVNVGDSVQFDLTSTPVIDQEPQTVSGTDGVAMTIEAQAGANTGPSGASGGSLYLRGGAPGFEVASGGAVYLQPQDGGGTVDALVATRTSVELGVPINMNGFDIDTEDGDLQVGAGQIVSDAGAVDFGDDITMGGTDIDLETGIIEGLSYAGMEQLDADSPPSVSPGPARYSGYFEDGDAGNPCLGVWDGSNWLRVALGAAVSSS
jgi:hypothetical protein